MQIVFCERCGMRISPGDLEGGRCKRDDMLAWCPTCSQAIGGARPAVAQVVATPMAQAPLGVAQVSGAQAQTMARRPSGGRPSMMSPPSSEVMQGRRPTTGAVTRPSGANPRPNTGAHRALTASATATMSNVRKAATNQTTVRRATPNPSSTTPGKDALAEPPPARDMTMIYIGAGAALLICAVVASLLLMKKDAPQPAKPVAKEKSSEPVPAKTAVPEKTIEWPGPVTKSPPRRETVGTNDIPVIRPTDTPAKTVEPVRPAPKTNEVEVPEDVPKALVEVPAQEPSIDGVLDDACWASAKEYTLEFIEGKAGRPVSRSTVKFLATEKMFFVAAHFEDKEMPSVPLPIKVKDTDAWADHCIEIFMLPGKDAAKDYVQWVVNVSGSIWDGMKVGTITNPGQWDAEGIVHKIKIGKDAWDIEIAIPFASIPGAAGKPYMRFNVTRNRPQVEGLQLPTEYSSWSILRRSSSHTPERFGLLAFKALGGKLP